MNPGCPRSTAAGRRGALALGSPRGVPAQLRGRRRPGARPAQETAHGAARRRRARPPGSGARGFPLAAAGPRARRGRNGRAQEGARGLRGRARAGDASRPRRLGGPGARGPLWSPQRPLEVGASGQRQASRASSPVPLPVPEERAPDLRPPAPSTFCSQGVGGEGSGWRTQEGTGTRWDASAEALLPPQPARALPSPGSQTDISQKWGLGSSSWPSAQVAGSRGSVLGA